MTTVQVRVLLFFLVTYALTWFGWLGNWLLPSDYWPLPMNPLGPLLAAPLVIWLTEGKAGIVAWLRRVARFRAPGWVYLVAFATPLAFILLSVIATTATGAATRPLPQLEAAEFLILIPIMLIAGPAPEELSFRGHGLHALEAEMSPLAASLWIGIGVVVWHTPLLILGDVAWPFAVTIVAVSVVYAWLFQMGGSVWPLVLLHFVVNYFGGEYFGSIVAEPEGQIVYAMFFMACYLAWVAYILVRYGRMLRPASQPV